MLTFFRRIRKSFLISNRPRKYLLYAIGEIALVVIGILIALRINNWNENRKSLVLEQAYYCKLLEDVSQDADQINKMIRESQKRSQHANELIHTLQQESVDLHDIMEKTLASLSLITSTFTPGQSAFEDLKSSGNLNILRDADLKKELLDYHVKLNGLVDVADYHANEAVRQLYKKEDFTSIGWHHMSFVRSGIDTNLVKVHDLDRNKLTDAELKNIFLSDGLMYVGANTRITEMYILIAEEIATFQIKLQKKCP